MKKLIVLILCLVTVGCQFGGEDAVYEAPVFYKYYLNPDVSVEENIATSLEQANLPETSITPIIVDEMYNTVVIVEVKSPVEKIGSFGFKLDQFEAVGYSVEDYVDRYADEAVTLVEGAKNELLVLVCAESEGIPNTALWYEDEKQNLELIELVPGGIEENEGLIE